MSDMNLFSPFFILINSLAAKHDLEAERGKAEAAGVLEGAGVEDIIGAEVGEMVLTLGATAVAGNPALSKVFVNAVTFDVKVD